MDSLSVFGLAQKKRKIFFWIRKSGFGCSQKTHPKINLFDKSSTCYYLNFIILRNNILNFS